MKENAIDLAIQGFRTVLSGLSFGSLLITFINSIISGSVAIGLPLTLFIFFLTKSIEYLEKILRKHRMLGDKSPTINVLSVVIAFIFLMANLVFCFIVSSDTVLMIFLIFDIVAVIYYLAIDVIAVVIQSINFQKN